MGLPDFLIIGAPKAGSTALHTALARHPELFLTTPKEPKYFLCEDAPPPLETQRGPGDRHSAREWVWQPARYRGLFDAAPEGTLKGESTPFYLWDRAAHRRIHAVVPHVKMIAVIRDPIDRAYSNWTHLWCDGMETEPDFLAGCAREPERVAAGYAPFWRYLELSRYGEQLEHLRRFFRPEQIYVLRYRELVDEPQRTLDAICGFLGVRAGLIGGLPPSNVSTWVPDTAANAALRRVIRAGAAAGGWAPPAVWRTASRPLLTALRRGHRNRPPLAPDVRRLLAGHFADDVALLGRLTGRSYDDWLDENDRGTYSLRRS